jgi:hypothetical protein
MKTRKMDRHFPILEHETKTIDVANNTHHSIPTPPTPQKKKIYIYIYINHHQQLTNPISIIIKNFQQSVKGSIFLVINDN